MGLLRPDAIFYGLSREPDKNCATLAKKGSDMDHQCGGSGDSKVHKLESVKMVKTPGREAV